MPKSRDFNFNQDRKLYLFRLIKKNKNVAAEFIEAISHAIDEKDEKELKDFLSLASPMPIKAEQLMELGFKGRELGLLIQELEVLWIECKFNKTFFIIILIFIFLNSNFLKL